MDEIKQIPGITEAEVLALAATNIDSLDTLWLQIGQDGIDKVAKEAQIPSARLAELLLRQAEKEADSSVEPFLRRFGLEIGGILVAFVIIMLLLRLFGIIDLLSPPSARDLVIASRPIAAYSIITNADLITETKLTRQEGFTNTADLVGRLTLQTIDQAETIQAEKVSDLVPGKPDLSGHLILSLPIAPEMVSAHLQTGETLTLLLFADAPETGSPQTVMLTNTILIEVRSLPDASSLVVAIPETELGLLSSLPQMPQVLIVKPG